MNWIVGLVANAVVAVAYVSISTVIARALIRSGQIRSNPLGAATAGIFLTCGVHHGGHSLHMVLPWLGVDVDRGLAMRTSYDLPMAAWDVVAAGVGLYYWTLRRSYSPLMRGATLFEDLRQREQQALELNDNVLQGLVVAKLALDLGEHDRARAALQSSIASAGTIITDLLGPDHRGPATVLLRSSAALPRPVPATEDAT